MPDRNAHGTAEAMARSSYGRLLALLATRTRDIAAAEDALAEAFAAALRVWPARGVPANPSAWLFTVARRRISAAWRHGQVQVRSQVAIEMIHDPMQGRDQTALPDERMRLLFVCTHPPSTRASARP